MKNTEHITINVVINKKNLGASHNLQVPARIMIQRRRFWTLEDTPGVAIVPIVPESAEQ